jgi:3-deoxy-D-manno-octulosonic-acid transferase
VLAERLPAGVIHQYAPVDTPGAASRFLDHWRPDLGVLVESELWPNLLLGAKARGVRLALLSAKLSQASARGWSRAPRAARTLLGAFDLILARDEAAAAGLRRLGADVAGLADLKFGAEPLPADPVRLGSIQAEIGDRPVFLAASTHPGEDEIIIDAFLAAIGQDAAPLLLIAPRHPQRGLTVAALAWSRGASVAVRSAGESPRSASVYVADTVGEMGLWFRLAHLAIMGGSFADVGGHNPLEPARLGRPFISGPNVANWASVYADLWRINGDGPVIDPPELEARITAALAGLDKAGAERIRAHVQACDTGARLAQDQVLALLP